MQNWSVRMQDADFSASDTEYLRWAYGQATKDLANGWATGLPIIRRAATKVRERIEAELSSR
jgi:hypothetical protein